MHDMIKEFNRMIECNRMKRGALMAWPILPIFLGIPVLLWGEPKEQIGFVLSIIVLVSTAICLPLFVYGAYGEDKLIQDNQKKEMEEFLRYKKEDEKRCQNKKMKY